MNDLQEDVPIVTRQGMVFMHDRAPTHVSTAGLLLQGHPVYYKHTYSEQSIINQIYYFINSKQNSSQFFLVK